MTLPAHQTDRPLTVGFWIETPPDHALHGEGIARTAAAVIRGLTRRDDTRVVVAVASWSARPVEHLLDDWAVPRERVEIMTSRAREPFVVRQRRRMRRARRGWASRLYAAVARLVHTDAAQWVFEKVSGVTSWPAAALLALAGALLLAPVLLIAGLVLAGAVLTAAVGRRLRRMRGNADTRWRVRLRTLKSQAYGYLRDAVVRNEFQLLARRATRGTHVDVWFITHPGSVHALRLKAPAVVAVPDLVYTDFPTCFDTHWARQTDERVRRVVARARSVISYSEHVARRHVERHLGVPREAVHVMPHAPFDAARALREDSADAGRTDHQRAVRIVERFLEERRARAVSDAGLDAYLRGFPFGEVPYLFVTSQVRPTKNYLNLFRAFEVLLRTRYRNVKLVMTGDLTSFDGQALQRHVDSRRLHLDILSVPAMPERVHAAFLHLAAVTVVPTLFEGGFPFPFSESLSVETPVLMSDIPVARAVVPGALAPLMLFDPTDVHAMVERIDWALSNRQSLLNAERPFFAQLSTRTWDDVAADYRRVFAAAASSSPIG